jgi:hypothetical protein
VWPEELLWPNSQHLGPAPTGQHAEWNRRLGSGGPFEHGWPRNNGQDIFKGSILGPFCCGWLFLFLTNMQQLFRAAGVQNIGGDGASRMATMTGQPPSIVEPAREPLLAARYQPCAEARLRSASRVGGQTAAEQGHVADFGGLHNFEH